MIHKSHYSNLWISLMQETFKSICLFINWW